LYRKLEIVAVTLSQTFGGSTIDYEHLGSLDFKGGHFVFKTSLSVLALGLLVAGASAQVRFRLVKTVDLGGNGFNVTSSSSANYIGPHIYSITNDGGKVYVGGYNNSGATAGVRVLQINDFLGSTTVGRVLGSQSLSNAPISGGYYGVAVKNGVL